MKLHFQQVEYNSPLYLELLPLREQVLRTPLGLFYSKDDIAAEEDQIQLVAFSEKTPVGSLLIISKPDSVAKIRQVAVFDGFRGHGIGRNLMIHAEEYCKAHSYKKITMHARVSVRDFYLKLGYKQLGSVFTEVGIDHMVMEKAL